MNKMMKSFLGNESGAAVVDMTMLMAALVSLALAVSVQVSNGMNDTSGELESTIAERDTGSA